MLKKNYGVDYMATAYEIFNDIKALRNLVRPRMPMKIVLHIPRYGIRDEMENHNSHYCIILVLNNLVDFDHRNILYPYYDYNGKLRCYLLFDGVEALDREYMRYLIKSCNNIELLSVSGF